MYKTKEEHDAYVARMRKAAIESEKRLNELRDKMFNSKPDNSLHDARVQYRKHLMAQQA